MQEGGAYRALSQSHMDVCYCAFVEGKPGLEPEVKTFPASGPRVVPGVNARVQTNEHVVYTV